MPRVRSISIDAKEKKNVKRVAVFENLSIPEDYDVMSVEPGDEDSDAIYRDPNKLLQVELDKLRLKNS